MKILKNKHSCNLLSYFSNKITFIVPKLIMIAQIKHWHKIQHICQNIQKLLILSFHIIFMFVNSALIDDAVKQ